MTPDARRKLRELAEVATQRDWCVNGQHVEARPGPPVAWCASGFSASAAGCTSIDETEARANAAYIAAAHPGAIIELLDDLEAAHGQRELDREYMIALEARAEAAEQKVRNTV